MSPSEIPSNQSTSAARRMVRAELLGQHTHATAVGVDVHIWRREGKFLARGRYNGAAFGESLGDNPEDAISKLRHLLVDLDNGTYIRASDRPKRQLRRGSPPKLDVRALCDSFLTEKRRTRGAETCRTYRGRLAPLIEFAEAPNIRQRYCQSADLERQFVLDFRLFLCQRLVSRNGRASAAKKLMSPHQTYNVLDTCRTMFNWARKPEVNLLPSHFANPFTDDLVGQPPKRDPLKPAAFPLHKRIAMVEIMDAWQLAHLAWPLVLPLRPEDFQGFFIDEVDRDAHLLRFGERLGGADFNKGRQQFVCPYPQDLAWLIDYCIGLRSAGPLLRRRDVFSGRRRASVEVAASTDVKREMETALANARSGDLQAPQDFKRVVRRSIVALGGVSTNRLRKELRQVFERAGFGRGATPYELRHSINSEFEQAGVGFLTHRYVTGHRTNDILNAYTTLAPEREMQKYFATIVPLFDTIRARAQKLSLLERSS
jgi:hypothetical protein